MHSVLHETLDVPARGSEPARTQDATEERDETITLLDVDGAIVKRMIVEITKHRLRDAEGKMAPGPLEGVSAELVGDGESIAVHPVGAPLDAATKERLGDPHRSVGRRNPFLTIGPLAPQIGVRSAEYEEPITKWMHRDESSAKGHVPEVRAMLTQCEPELATFTVRYRLVGQQMGWNVEGRTDGTVVIARHDGRPTSVSLKTSFTGTAPDAQGKLTGGSEQTVTWRYE